MDRQEKNIPAVWREELLEEDEGESSLSVTIFEMCGPLLLLLYKRCILYSSVYEELKDLRSLFLTGALCYTEYKK